MEDRRYFGARVSEQLYADLAEFARRHRWSLSVAGALLLEDALRRVNEQDGELVTR